MQIKEQKDAITKVEQEYDELNYVSYPFAYTRPEYTKAIGSLFDFKAPDISKARVLELGCVNGGNIINFALCYPNSYSLGIDITENQINIGLERIIELKLKNIDLKHLSISDLDESYGKFDYIICQGVFSWVTDSVREKIFAISKKLLNPDGIVLISYNTLPGWNMMNTIRDMQLFHSSMFSDVSTKLQQSKLFLKFVNESLKDSDSAYARFLKEETARLETQEDHYIRHDLLAANNKQLYFHEFMQMAAEHDFTYLADSNFQLMYTGNLPAYAAEKLATVQDIVRTEQYMDFIHNRRFRITLLCHKGKELKRNIDAKVIESLYTTCNLMPEKQLEEIDINDVNEKISFYDSLETKNNVFTTSSAVVKAIFYTYRENVGNPLSFKELMKLSHKKIATISITDMEKEFCDLILQLIFSGHIRIFGEKPKSIYHISDKPQVSELVRYQVTHPVNNKYVITNQINEAAILSPHEIYIASNLDGKNTIEDLNNIILEKLKSGELIASSNKEPIKDEENLKLIASESIKQTLEKFRVNYLLVN